MSYFTRQDHNAVLAYQVGSPNGGVDVERAYQRMHTLQQNLARKIKAVGLRLFVNHTVPGWISQNSVTASTPQQIMSMAFSRSETDMRNVEISMGHDGLHAYTQLESRRHPVIELRLSPEHFVVELAVSPDAWYDQQNFAGKFTLQEHRAALYQLMKMMRGDYFIGFWSGIYPQELHLSTAQLPPPHVFVAFMETFAAGRDTIRAGVWYEVEDPALNEETIESELIQRIRDLYSLYDYILWSGNNNYHKFYRKMLAR